MEIGDGFTMVLPRLRPEAADRTRYRSRHQGAPWSRKSGSQLTRRWRKMDSNPRNHRNRHPLVVTIGPPRKAANRDRLGVPPAEGPIARRIRLQRFKERMGWPPITEWGQRTRVKQSSRARLLNYRGFSRGGC